MDHTMTEAEITRAMALLEEEEQAEVKKVQLGKWIVVSENGILTVQPSKAAAIREAMSHHSQSRQHCKISDCGPALMTWTFWTSMKTLRRGSTTSTL